MIDSSPAPAMTFRFGSDKPSSTATLAIRKAVEQGIQVEWVHADKGMDEEAEGELTMRMYFPQELDALIQYNGFTIDAKFGIYAQATFDAHSGKQPVVCSVPS